MTTTEERMEILEKQVRRQRRWNIGLGVLVVAGGLMAAKGVQEVPDVIRAKKIEVVNDDGKIRVGMGTSKRNGGGAFILFNGSQQEVAVIGAGADGGFLGLSNNDEVPQTIVGVGKDGGNIALKNSDGKIATAMSVVEDGLGFLTVSNSEGKGGVQIMSLPDGKGGAIRITDANGKHRNIQ